MNKNQLVKIFWNNPNLWEIYGLADYYRERCSVVKEMFPDNIGKILDVGAGKGDIVNDIYRLYNNVTALDISTEALKHVNCPSRVNGEIENLPFQSNNFDLVICLEVLEHLSDLSFKKGVFELQRVANNYLIIGVPYKENIHLRKTRCPSCQGIFNADGHFRTFYSLRSLCCWFPQFELVNKSLIGPSTRRNSFLGMWIQNVIARAYLPWDSYFTCIYCGCNGIHAEKETNPFKQRVTKRVNLLLSSRKKIPYWLIVLLKRKS